MMVLGNVMMIVIIMMLIVISLENAIMVYDYLGNLYGGL